MNTAVIGLGFGDEGKGLAVDYLCQQAIDDGDMPLVVRFNGGHQAGHTVIRNGFKHVFSSFGAGTLLRCPTYWSRHCTFYPTAFLNERAILDKFDPLVWVHPDAPITTPMEVRLNQNMETSRGRQRHGSCGVGVGATWDREESNYHLLVRDLFYPGVLRAKLNNIRARYQDGVDLEAFILQCAQCASMIKVSDHIPSYDTWIFEGAQGVLLDQQFGFFPHVTRSFSSSLNALDMGADDILYVIRTYQTRHGEGYMGSHEQAQSLPIRNAISETNAWHPWQGGFRTAELDIELLNYAIACERSIAGDRKVSRRLLITCNDQYPIDIGALLHSINYSFKEVLLSYGPTAKDIITYEPHLETILTPR